MAQRLKKKIAQDHVQLHTRKEFPALADAVCIAVNKLCSARQYTTKTNVYKDGHPILPLVLFVQAERCSYSHRQYIF